MKPIFPVALVVAMNEYVVSSKDKTSLKNACVSTRSKPR
jgi:hypothetical protein